MTRLGRPFPVHVHIYLAAEMHFFLAGEARAQTSRGFQTENSNILQFWLGFHFGNIGASS